MNAIVSLILEAVLYFSSNIFNNVLFQIQNAIIIIRHSAEQSCILESADIVVPIL